MNLLFLLLYLLILFIEFILDYFNILIDILNNLKVLGKYWLKKIKQTNVLMIEMSFSQTTIAKQTIFICTIWVNTNE